MKKSKTNGPVETGDDIAGSPEGIDAPDAGSHTRAAGGAVVEPPDQAVIRISDELAAVKEQYLRLAADTDNFRKRVARERSETWTRAQADVVANLLDALDDMGRVAQLDPARATPQDILVGVQMVERKLLKHLEGAGLERVGTAGEPFNPNHHEAVSTIPAPTRGEDQTVASVFQPGYRFGGALLRPARVQVQIWSDSD